jgi:hypothetical protein
VSEEASSDAERTNRTTAETQILNFQFQPLAPGLARINRIALEWTQESGVVSSKLTVPGTELKIDRPFPRWIPISVIGAGIAIGVTFALRRFWSSRQATPTVTSAPTLTLSQQLLSDLRQVHESWRVSGETEKLLSAVTAAAHQFLAQELHWHAGRDNYNALSERASQKWTSKDARNIKSVLEQIEFIKYSGSDLSSRDLDELYQNVYKLIDQKQIIPRA